MASELNTPFLLKAGSRELCDFAFFPAASGKPLVVLIGWGHELMTDFTLAEILEFDVRVVGRAKTIQYVLGLSSFRSTIKQSIIDVDLSKAFVYRLNTVFSRAAPVIFVFRDDSEQIMADIHQKLMRAAIMAAQLGDWRLDQGIEWVTAEAVALGGELRPTAECELSTSFVWRLDGPVFRSGGAKPLMLWSLMLESALKNRNTLPVATVVTDYDGEIQRASDKFVLKNLRAPGPVQGKNRVIILEQLPQPEEVELLQSMEETIQNEIDEGEHAKVRRLQRPAPIIKAA